MKREIKCMNTDEGKKKDGFSNLFININFLYFIITLALIGVANGAGGEIQAL